MALPYAVFDEVNRLVIGKIIELQYTDLRDVKNDSRDFMCMFPEQLQDLKVKVLMVVVQEELPHPHLQEDNHQVIKNLHQKNQELIRM